MILTKVDLVEHLQGDLDICHLEFDNGADSAYIIWNHTNMIAYLNGEVIATFRQDMYKGSIAKFVNTLARVGVVHTLEREDNIKLYVDKADNHCTVCFRDLKEGQTHLKATVYVVDVTFDSSPRATWLDLTVQDRERRIATLRLFNPTVATHEFKGRYILCDIRKNKYGLSTDSIVTVDASFPYSPEVTVAEKFIMDTFADDADILRVMDSAGFIAAGKKHVSEEPGYVLVRLAIELDIANEMTNLTRDADMKVVKRALLMNRFRILNSASVFHDDIVGYASAARFQYPGYREVLETLFADNEERAKERTLVCAIQKLADETVKVKKGLV